MSALIGLIIGSMISSLVAAGISGATAIHNTNAQKEINQANLENQTEINEANLAASKEFAQNQIQWKVDDMKAAGLNPVLAAGGFGGSSEPTAMQATQQKAPIIDANGIASAINAMNNSMLTAYLMSQRNDIQAGRNSILSDKNDVLRGLYQRKAQFFDSGVQNRYVGNAKQVMSATDSADWDAMIKALDKIPGSKNNIFKYLRGK